MARPGAEASVIEQNVWAYAFESVMSLTLPRENREHVEAITAEAEKHADAVLAKFKKEHV